LHQLGEDLVLAPEFVLQGGDGAVLGVAIDFAASVVGGEGGGAVLEELFLPVVEVGDSDAVLFAQIGDGDFLQEMGPENGDLLLRSEVAALPAHECSSARVLPRTPTKANSRSDWGNTEEPAEEKGAVRLLWRRQGGCPTPEARKYAGKSKWAGES